MFRSGHEMNDVSFWSSIMEIEKYEFDHGSRANARSGRLV